MISPLRRLIQIRRDLARLKEIDALFERVNELHPCPTEDCIHVRGEAQRLSRKKVLEKE